MLLASGTLLFYTAMVVPVQIFMWDYTDQCNTFPTLFFDVLVDLFFLVSITRILQIIQHLIPKILRLQMEVVVPFFMGKLDVSDTYCDDIRVIARKYLASLTGFWFDFLTSLPWSVNDLYTLQVSFPPISHP